MILPGWLSNSRKARIALATIGGFFVNRLLVKLGWFTSDEINRINELAGIVASVWIGSIALEDFRTPSAPVPPDAGAGGKPSEPPGVIPAGKDGS